jgi:PleD family two-component response regulator
VLNVRDNPATLLARADKCLYEAKRAGRDNTKCETDLAVDRDSATG